MNRLRRDGLEPSRRLARLAAAIGVLAAAGCERAGPAPSGPGADEPPPTNRVEIGSVVRENLGITFAQVERRAVSRTLRVPGRFELLPTARREYRAAAPGRVDLAVEQYQRVDVGDVLYRFDSPHWRDLQRDLADADAALSLAEAASDSIAPFMEAHESHHIEIQSAVDLWVARVAELDALRSAGGVGGEQVAQARASLAAARADLAETLEKEAELMARQREAAAQLAASGARRRIALEAAAALTGLSVQELTHADQGVPRWQSLSQIEVRAAAPGVVDVLHVSSGAAVESSAPVLETVQPDLLRFRAAALQSDLGRLSDGQPATIVPPEGGSVDRTEQVRGTVMVAPTADPRSRTVELVMTPDASPPPWARAGVAAYLEVIVSGNGREELAIPLACVVRDGTQSIIFRRDPADPDRAIRMEADLGQDDGRWIVVRSGVAQGNEIVLDGVYQLMVATSSSMTRGGHFHPDGTFHEGDE